MKQLYEVIFYNGNQPLPTYYVIDQFACEDIEEELKNKISYLMNRVRNAFNIGDDVSNLKICKSLYVLQEDGLIPINNVE